MDIKNWLFLLGVVICFTLAAVSIFLETLLPGEMLWAATSRPHMKNPR